MELSRRDALAALATGGAAAGAGAAALASPAIRPRGTARDPEPTAGGGLGAHERETMVAVARVVYPSDVSGVAGFVETYLDGRRGDAFVAGVEEAVATLDELGREWHDGRAVALDAGTRERLLREAGADTAEADPDGSPAERVRYYLVNELLFALYASPTGGELVGVENPQGHPGGLSSYRRASPE